jgi:uncharacterized secreted protein with C-terminal beta-propeller domain
MRFMRSLSSVGIVCILLVVSLASSTTLLYIYNNYDNDDGAYLPNEINTEIITNCSQPNRFSSYEELEEYIGNAEPEVYYAFELCAVGDSASSADSAVNVQPSDYSTTNIQVEGVDEADIVKTDGEYIYVISENDIVIARGYPADKARVLSRIKIKNEAEEMFVNGDRLILFETTYYYSSYYRYKTLIKVYDISARTNPILIQNIAVNGSYFDSRMIEDYVYIIVEQSLEYNDDNITLPTIQKNGFSRSVDATEIGYFDVPAPSYKFTLILSINIMKNEALRYEVYLTDYAQEMYVSKENIYLTSSKYYYEDTTIHKISIDQGRIQYVCSSQVPGRILNQFSMDEYNGYFRVATTTGNRWDGNSKNNVYVLDDMLNSVGELENLAPGERIYSARFIRDRCYLVTFKEVDPFFVIDLIDPEYPRMLGKLKIPGYSDYLHPYDENHVIGIGKDARSVKMSLFDVTDVEHPIEISKIIIGDRYTDSYALRDHKAFLLGKSKNLLVIPIRDYVWQGAYVFNITLDNGFILKGRITHLNDDAQLEGGWYYSSPYYIKRSLYIENELYTLSEKMIKINSIDTLEEVNKIEL